MGFDVEYTYRWKCPGQGEVEGGAQFFRSGLVNFIQNDAGYSIDNYIHLKTPLLEHVWRHQQGGTATSAFMGTPPAGSVGGSASLSHQSGAQVQVSMGSQPRPLSYSFKLDKTSPTFDEGPACRTEYRRQIISRSELSGWVDGSPFFPAQLAVDIHSSLVSWFHLLPCPENEK